MLSASRTLGVYLAPDIEEEIHPRRFVHTKAEASQSASCTYVWFCVHNKSRLLCNRADIYKLNGQLPRCLLRLLMETKPLVLLCMYTTRNT